MKPLLFALIVLIAVGCSKEKGGELCCMNISLGADIAIQNAAGEDLLNPENPNSFKERDIRTYHLIDGEEQISHTEELLFEDNDEYRLRVFLNDDGNDEYPITYIDWNETDRDTIKSEIYRTSNQIRVIKIWYNDALVWDAEDLGPERFTIIK